jgi:hypothetical protein
MWTKIIHQSTKKIKNKRKYKNKHKKKGFEPQKINDLFENVHQREIKDTFFENKK